MFRALGEADLGRLEDDALIAYVRSARRHGHASSRVALAVLVYGHWHNVARRVALKVPAAMVEDVTSDVLVSALQSAFDGSSQGEFHVWLQTITARRIADFHRRPRAATVGLDEVSVEAPEQGVVVVADAVERVLERLQRRAPAGRRARSVRGARRLGGRRGQRGQRAPDHVPFPARVT